MKSIFALLALAGSMAALGQEKPLTDNEKAKLRTYWKQHWPEKVKAEVVKVYPTVAMIRISNNLPYNISKYHLNIQWYDAKGKLITAPYRSGGKIINSYNALEGYMKANTTQEAGITKVPGAATLKISVGFVELPKIGMKQDSL